MALKDMNLSGKVRAGNGDGVQDATVSLRAASANLAGTAHATTDTTDSAGTWEFTVEGSTFALTNAWDIEVASGDSKRYLAWSDQIALKGVDTSYLKIRGIGDTDPAPLYFLADRADDAGDAWRMQATTSDTFTIGSDKASAGTIIDYVTITNGASAAASVVALGGDLTVGDDLSLTSDSAVFNMGADSGFSITHDGDIGATIAGSPITITAAEASTWSTSSGALTITSAAALNLNPAGGYGVVLDGTVNVDAGLVTGVAGIFEADVRIGEDDQTKIDFETADEIHFYAANVEQVYVADNIFGPQSDSDVDLGTTGVRWKDAFVDSITVTGAISGAAGTFSGVLKTDDATEATSTTDGSLQTDGGLSVVKDAVFGDDVFLLSNSAVLNMGASSDAKLTHDSSAGLTIEAPVISIDATGGVLHLNSSSGDIKFQDGGTDQIAFDLDGTAGVVIMKPMVDSDDIVIQQYDGTEVLRVEDGGYLNVSNSTASSSATTGSAIFGGGIGVAADAYIGDDLYLITDSAVLGFGADKDTTLTHTDGTGLTLNSTNKLTFGDADTFIHQSSDGVLTIESDTTVDINGAVVFDGALSGITTLGASGVVTAAGFTIGSAAITEAELEILDGATVTTAELNYLDITTLGTSEASKAVTVDSSGDLLVPDSDKYKFGASSDMQLYHDGTDSYITNAEGALKLATETSGIAVSIGHTTSETTINDNLVVTGNIDLSSAGSINNVGNAGNDWSGTALTLANGAQLQTSEEGWLRQSSAGSSPWIYEVIGTTGAVSNDTSTDIVDITVPNQPQVGVLYLHYLTNSTAVDRVESGCIVVTFGRYQGSGVQHKIDANEASMPYSQGDNITGGETITVTASAAVAGATDATQTFTVSITSNNSNGVNAVTHWRANLMSSYGLAPNATYYMTMAKA